MNFNGKTMTAFATFTSGGDDYNEGYEAGLTEGFKNGYNSGHTEGYDEGEAAGKAEGVEIGKAEAIENLPAGYLKVDPTWTLFANLCNGRPSIGLSIKYNDTANGTDFVSMCQSWDTTKGTSFTVPSWDLRKATTIKSMFLYSNGIVEIGEMEIPNVTTTQTAFNGCTKLERISFAPNCIKVSIGFPASNLLDDASIQSIIGGLADLTGKTTQTLTFHADVGAKLTDEQKLDISSKNWTLAY